MNTWKLVAATVLLGCTSLASADPIVADETYVLGNHPDGGAADPLYGLRLDGLLTGNPVGSPHEIYTFDFEAAGAYMQMLWDGTANTIRIWGDAYGGQDSGSAYVTGTTDWWEIDFLYTNVMGCYGDAVCSNTGSGSLVSSLFGSFDLTPVGAATHGYTFRVDEDHRGVSDLSGWGWMNHCPSDSNTTSTSVASCSSHIYSSDWLFTAHSVPEPGTLSLFGLGLLGLGLARRRKTA